MAMGLKVTDTSGAPIRFDHATGSFFGKLVTGSPFGIGWMLAGWTSRRQAIHDMMATTCVVFREVERAVPCRPRAPMPWYGWVLNLLPFVFAGIGMIAYGWLMAALIGGMGAASRDLGNMDIPDMDGSSSSMSSPAWTWKPISSPCRPGCRASPARSPR